MAIQWFIHEWPKLPQASYLEVGIYNGYALRSIGAKHKTGVDINPHSIENPDFEFYQMDSSVFFAQCDPLRKWDLIYIDADHSWRGVLKDINNSIKHLSPGGLLTIHDLFPQDESFTQPCYCGDGYKVLLVLRERAERGEIGLWTTDGDYGQSIIRGAESMKEISLGEVDTTLTYSRFRKIMTGYRLYTPDEIRAITKKL